MGVNMIPLILASLAVAALPSSSLPQLSTPQPEETEVGAKNVEAEDTNGDDVDQNFTKYLKLCTSLGIPPITLGSGYTAQYPSYGGYGGSYGNSYPAYSGYSGNAGYPAYTYPSGGYNVYYRGNAAGRSAEMETPEDSTEGNVEKDYEEYQKLCSTLGLPSIPLSSAYSSPYPNYGFYGGSSNYGFGYTGSSGYNGYNGYSGYPSYPYVNPVYYRGKAAGRSAETETPEDSIKGNVEKDFKEYLKLCSTLGLPSAYSSPYYGGSSIYGYSGYGGNSGYGSYSGYGYPVGNSGYPAYVYSSNSGYGGY